MLRTMMNIRFQPLDFPLAVMPTNSAILNDILREVMEKFRADPVAFLAEHVHEFNFQVVDIEISNQNGHGEVQIIK